MRRAICGLLGAAELALAGGLVYVSGLLPDRTEVMGHFDRFGHVSRGAERQVNVFREQVHELRRNELTDLAERLGPHARTVAQMLRDQQPDFDTVAAVANSLEQVAESLDAWAETLDGSRVRGLSDALGETAAYLEEDVVPSARSATEGMEKATDALEKDTRQLGELLAKAPPDLKAAREIHNSLARFESALERVAPVLKLERLTAIREGFDGMNTALTTTAGQVEKLAGYTYPVVTIDGIRPKVQQKAFWPTGKEIAQGLRKAVTGLRAADKELAGLDKEMPAIRESLDESRRAVAVTREAMAKALEQQDEIESLLTDIPKRTATLATELPKLGQSFTQVLKRTERLTEVAASLRKVRQALDASLGHWPELQKSLKKSAVTLSATRKQFDRVLEHQDDYERALTASTALAEQFSHLLPLFTERLDARLGEQELALERLEGGLTEVNEGLPTLAEETGDLVGSLRWLLWLVAGIVGIHGIYVVVDANVRPPGRET